MEYIKLIIGIGFIIAFTWIFIRNTKRSGFVKALIGFEIIIVIIVGLYLTFTSIHALIF